MKSPSRRTFLAGLGGVGLAGLGYTVGRSQTNGVAEPDASAEFWIDKLLLWNLSTEAIDLDLAVFRDGERVVWKTYALAANDGSSARDEALVSIPEADRRAGDWVLAARLVETDASVYYDLKKPKAAPRDVSFRFELTPDRDFHLLYDVNDD
ncbi:hypothetical protein [Salarchaeum sp. JOR-1]|uniref:hypothetical protein n=1 Tax=Salarchaeum sp. JOR-1 TaxID=2599399 RepID=UPI0011989CD9|nr:hypothetical protein [Salarchaeum sp. JOR-1]QDX40147.1 hypothetical protein FQU85_04290 [Salarchaeum sp. JOR-1]